MRPASPARSPNRASSPRAWKMGSKSAAGDGARRLELGRRPHPPPARKQHAADAFELGRAVQGELDQTLAFLEQWQKYAIDLEAYATELERETAAANDNLQREHSRTAWYQRRLEELETQVENLHARIEAVQAHRSAAVLELEDVQADRRRLEELEAQIEQQQQEINMQERAPWGWNSYRNEYQDSERSGLRSGYADDGRKRQKAARSGGIQQTLFDGADRAVSTLLKDWEALGDADGGA